ncbi:DnaJ C-terminal domain-containing protein, partial [Thermodesulfobacteriota bacterium]
PGIVKFLTGRGSTNHQRKGADLRYDMTLDFMEAAFGTETEINVDKMETCPECSGSQCEPGTQPETCRHCNGMGQVSRSQGFFTVRTTCPACNGIGQAIPHPCKNCRGAGQVRVSKTVSVKIPAGVDTGSRLRLTGEGEASVSGGPSGDLYVFLDVRPHEYFTRNNTDVICQVEVSFVQAALGDTLKVPTLRGEKSLKIPKATQPGDIFRFPNEGIPSLRSGMTGDQIVQVVIKTPKNLNKKQIQLLKEFAKIESSKLTNKLRNILKEGSTRAAR